MRCEVRGDVIDFPYKPPQHNETIDVFYIKISRYRPGVAQKVGRGINLLFHDGGTRRV